MTVIVTGATGFIGGHLVNALSAAGTNVRCLVRTRVETEHRPTVRFHAADFSRTGLGVPADVFAGVDTVYHVAGATRALSQAAYHEANVATTERLMECAARAGESPRFVFVSSQAAAGPARDARTPLAERDPAAPIEPYGRSKRAAEEAVLARRHEMPVTIVRPVAVYGPRDRDFLSVFRSAKRGLAFFPGSGDSIINTIHVDDLVRGLIAAAGSSAAVGQTYFMGHPDGASWRTIYSEAGRVAGHDRPREITIPLAALRAGGALGDAVGRITGRVPLINSTKAALAAPGFWLCSPAKASRDFGFRPSISLRDGLGATYDWYVRNRWL